MDHNRKKAPLSHYVLAFLPFNLLTAAIAVGFTCQLALGHRIKGLDTLGWATIIWIVGFTVIAVIVVASGLTSRFR
jgi:hypothetical protein